MSHSSLSIVIVAFNECELLRHTVEALAESAPDAQIVVVDDHSTDHSADFLATGGWRQVTLVHAPSRLGVAAARNLGASRAKGDTLVFSDAHVEPSDGWADSLQRALDDPTAGAAAPAITALDGPRATYGYGFTWRDPTLVAHWLTGRPPETAPAPFLSGCFMATPRRVFDELGGFDPGFRIWGHEDAEYSLRVWLGGYRCVVAPDTWVAHRFQSSFGYELDPAVVLHNRLRTGVLHLSPHPLSVLLYHARRDPDHQAAFQMLMASDIWRRRDEVRAVRRRSDEWFFSHHDIHALVAAVAPASERISPRAT